MSPVVPQVRGRDPSRTRASILDAAEAVFLQRGFRGASLRRIASLGNVTRSLIYHHFGSKKALWQEVRRRLIDGFSKQQREIIAGGEEDKAGLDESIRTLFSFLQKSPEYVRLSTWMGLEAPRLSSPADPELLDEVLKRFCEGQKGGQFRSDVAPWHIKVVILSLCTHRFLENGADGWKENSGADPAGGSDQAYLDDMLRVFFEGLLPR